MVTDLNTQNLYNCTKEDYDLEMLISKLVRELKDDYIIIAHDGNGLNGEHYSVGYEELKKHIAMVLTDNGFTKLRVVKGKERNHE